MSDSKRAERLRPFFVDCAKLMASNETNADNFRKPREGSDWEEFWARGVNPGDAFDKLGPLPELVDQVRFLQLPGGEIAAVPGCGRGYDVELLSRSGLFKLVLGIDVSPTAVNAAKTYLSGVTPPLPSNYDVFTADFFMDDLQQVDFVYDYTFFCAIPPAWRMDWGKRMAKLIRPGGTLVTIMYPYTDVSGDGAQTGPPYPVNEQVYREALGSAFVPKDGPRKLNNSKVHPGREGRTRWCRWERVE